MTKLLFILMTFLVPLEAQEVSHGEPVDDARERYELIADAIADEAGENDTLALYLLTVARHESGFTRAVHAGEVRGDDQRSWGCWQIMVGYHPTDRIKDHPKEWLARDIVGTTEAATKRAVWTAAWILRMKIERCGASNPTCVFKAYGGVAAGPMRGKTKDRIHARVSTFRKLRQKLQAARDDG